MSKTVEKAMKIHDEAMDFSGKAQAAQIRGVDEGEVLAFFRKAFRLEKEAAMLLKDENFIINASRLSVYTVQLSE